MFINHRVEIFEHEHAWAVHARALEDFAHVFLVRVVVRFEAADVETRLAELVYQRLERVRLAVPGWTDEDRATLPRNLVTLVDLTRFEELSKIVLDLLLQWIRQYEVLECRAPDRVEEALVFPEVAVVVDENLATHFTRPLANRTEEVF